MSGGEIAVYYHAIINGGFFDQAAVPGGSVGILDVQVYGRILDMGIAL